MNELLVAWIGQSEVGFGLGNGFLPDGLGKDLGCDPIWAE